jgi:hypothetical protein
MMSTPTPTSAADDGQAAPAAGRAASRYASRKFLLTAALLAASTVLLLYGRIDAATWSQTVTWALGLYMAGNTASWATDALRTRAAP